VYSARVHGLLVQLDLRTRRAAVHLLHATTIAIRNPSQPSRTELFDCETCSVAANGSLLCGAGIATGLSYGSASIGSLAQIIEAACQ